MLPEEQEALTPAELRLRTLLRILFFFYLAAALFYLLPSITFIPGFLKPFSFINDAAFANNSTIKMLLFSSLCYVGAADVRRHLIAVEAIIVTMLLGAVAGLLIFFFVKNNYPVYMGSKAVPIKTLILASTLFDIALNVLLIIFYRKAQRDRYQLHYFSPMQFRTMIALPM